MSNVAALGAAESPPWKRGLGWLLFLGPFFFLSYGFANHLAAQRAVSDSLLFDWERHIPFVPWTILPYWSIDLFYGLSFLLCRDLRQVDIHALRLLTAQLVSVACFVLFPLRFSFERPVTDGWYGAMFDALGGFDKPYNQAPSLHIGLLVILWARFADATPQPWRPLLHAWSILIGASVLTTYQHHFVDIPTGVLVGLLCLWTWPDTGSSPLRLRQTSPLSERHRPARRYLLGGLVLAALAVFLGGGALWLWWGAVALGLVAFLYIGPGAAGFQKTGGRHSLPVAILLAPYIAGAWLNSRWWTRRHPQSDAIIDNVWLGRIPLSSDMTNGGFAALVDLTAELPAPRGPWHYAGLPWLDLVVPTPVDLEAAAGEIEAARDCGPVLVCCALGYSRSASAVAAWLLLSGRAASPEAAEAMILAQRPGVVLSASHRAALAAVAASLESGNRPAPA